MHMLVDVLLLYTLDMEFTWLDKVIVSFLVFMIIIEFLKSYFGDEDEDEDEDFDNYGDNYY